MFRDFFISLREDKYKRHIVLAFFLFFLFLVFFTEPYFNTFNIVSRYLTIESIVEDHDFIIDDKHDATEDIIYRDGHWYSSKPPVLPIVASSVYYVAHNFFNQDFPSFDEVHEDQYYYSLYPTVYFTSLIFVGGTFLLLLFYFYKTLKLFSIDKKHHLPLILGLGIGTLFFSYSITLNNHTIAGALLFISFYYLLLLKNEVNNVAKLNQRLAISGFLASLAAVIDLPTGLTFYGLFFLYFLFKFGYKKIIYYIWPAVIILAIHFYFNYQIFGGFLPAQVYKQYWIGPDGDWINQEASPDFSYRNAWPIYLFNILIGSHGLLLYTPVLALAFYGMYKIIKEKKEFLWEAVLVLVGFLLVIIFYTFFSRAYGGTAYGFRWFIAVTPLIYFFIIFLFQGQPSRKISLIFTLLFGWSAIFAIIGAYDPWPAGFVFDLWGQTWLGSPIIMNLFFLKTHVLY